MFLRSRAVKKVHEEARSHALAAEHASTLTEDLRLALAGGVAAAAAAALLAASSVSWEAAIAAFVLGACVAGAAIGLMRWRHLSAAARACRAIRGGDLGQTVPEQGDRYLVESAQTINGMTVDFQEVLLMFEDLTRSASRAAGELEKRLMDDIGAPLEDQKRAADVVSGLNQMQTAVREYKLYRISLEDGRIVDTGIAKPSGEHAGSDGKKLGPDSTALTGD